MKILHGVIFKTFVWNFFLLKKYVNGKLMNFYKY